MKAKAPSLFAALLLGLLSNVLLRGQTGYWPRAGLAALVFCVPLLALVGWAFALCWQQGQNPVFRWLFALLLAVSSVLELLRLWQLAARAYPGAVSLGAICVTVLLPVIYLRRVSAISQTGRVTLCLLVLACLVMVVSVAPRLRLQNLQVLALTVGNITAAARDQLTLYPEYLLPALWLNENSHQKSHTPRTALYLAGAAVGFDVAIHFLLALFFGAAMPLRADPVTAAARCGALSVFNRLEWLQLVLWLMATSVKLALYLYGMIRLLGGHANQKNTAVGLDRYPFYFGGVLLFCVLLRKVDIALLLQWRSAAAWAFALLVGLGGVAVCLFKKPKRCC